jgi:hypothetical protein
MLILISEIFFVENENEQAAGGKLVEMVDKLSQFWQRTNDTDTTMLTL